MTANVTLNMKAGSHSAQMIVRKVGALLIMFESADGTISYAAPKELYQGLDEGDQCLMHFGFVKPELVPILPESSIIMPDKKLIT
jgi:hypothetical protein